MEWEMAKNRRHRKRLRMCSRWQETDETQTSRTEREGEIPLILGAAGNLVMRSMNGCAGSVFIS